jgi:hypothetical protein
VSYKASCSALAALAHQHPKAIEDITIPVERLVQLVRGDVINDLHQALAALVNLAIAGHDESDRRAKELLHAQVSSLCRDLFGQPGTSSFFEAVSGRSHRETWAGCIVSLTILTRSSLSASRSVSSLSLAEKASRVFLASYFLR